MGQRQCKKCGSDSFHTERKGNKTGLYCNKCGEFIKWLGKEDLQDIVERIEKFSDFLTKEIELALLNVKNSQEDSIRIEAYTLALDRCQTSIKRIIDGKEYCWKKKQNGSL